MYMYVYVYVGYYIYIYRVRKLSYAPVQKWWDTVLAVEKSPMQNPVFGISGFFHIPLGGSFP